MAIPTLRSPTISAGGLIPEIHTAKGSGISPALSWRRSPPGRPYLTIVARSWLADGSDEIVHFLVYDVLGFLGGLKENVAEGPALTIGLNSKGDAEFLPFSGVVSRQARFEMFASSGPTELNEPAQWEDVASFLKKQNALGPFGFTAYDADLPTLLGEF